MRSINTNSVRHRVYEYIKTNPGCLRRDIVSDLSLSISSVDSALAHLRKDNVIEGVGQLGSTGKEWFDIEPEAEVEYQKLAEDILEGLRGISPLLRVDYLAQELQKLSKKR